MNSRKPTKAKSIPVKKGTRVTLVVAEFNAEITAALRAECEKELLGQGVFKQNITIVKVPGAFELPYACQKIAQRPIGSSRIRPDAVIALGAVVRGQTPHFDYVARGVTHGIMQAGLASPCPIIFGVLTTENIRQAKARIGKGAEFARGALQMIHL